MGNLREFTVAPRRPDPCPNQCRSWARLVGGLLVYDQQGHAHNPACPAGNDPCPHNCGSWASRMATAIRYTPGADGGRHHPDCPAVRHHWRFATCTQFRRGPGSPRVEERRPVFVPLTDAARKLMAKQNCRGGIIAAIFGPLYTGGTGTALVDDSWVPALRLTSIPAHVADDIVGRLDSAARALEL